jgi:hypothetical protein
VRQRQNNSKNTCLGVKIGKKKCYKQTFWELLVFFRLGALFELCQRSAPYVDGFAAVHTVVLSCS